MEQFSGRASFVRCLLVLLTVTAGVAALVTGLLPDVLALLSAVRSGTVAGEPFDEVLVRGCEVAVAGCAVWLWLATLVVTRDAARGRMRGHCGVPRAWRRLVLTACGVALVGAVGAPAHADGEAQELASGRTATARPRDHDDVRQPGVRSPGGVTPEPTRPPRRASGRPWWSSGPETRCGPSPGPSFRLTPTAVPWPRECARSIRRTVR